MVSDSNKRLAKNTIILNIRLVISLIIGLYTSRVILQVLGVEDYGLYNLVGGFVTLLNIFTSSITGAAQRFITYELGVGNVKSLNMTFSTILSVLLLLSVIIGLIGAIVGSWFVTSYLNIPDERIGAGLFVYGCSVLVFILNMLAVPYIAEVTAHEHMNFYAVMSLFESFGKLGVVITLQFVNGDHLKEYAAGLAFVALISRLVYGWYCSRNFEETKFRFSFDRKIMKGIFSFSVWMGIGSACGILKDQGGSILLNMFFGLVLNAAMGIATQVKGLISSFCNSIGMAISPQITKSYASGNLQRAFDLTFLMAKCQGSFMALVAIPIFIEMPYLLSLWLGSYPPYTIEFSRFIIIVTFLNSLSMGFGPLFLAVGKIRNYQLIGSCITVSYIPVCYLLLKYFQNPLVCMYVSVCVEAILLVTNYVCLKLQTGFPIIKFYKQVILPILVIGVVCTLLTQLSINITGNESFIRLIITGLISTALLIVLLFVFVLSATEKALLVNYFKTKIK